MVVAVQGVGRAELVPVDLRSDGLGGQPVTSSQPRLSWRVESAMRAQSQSAWQILVAGSAEVLAKDQGDLWDSGKQAATRSPFAGYGGQPLEPGKVYHWKVRCWDAADQPSAWSAPAVLEIAPMTPADWSGARWIDDGRDNPTRDEDFYQPDPAPLLRQEFTLAKPVVRARLHVAGLGYVLSSLNGQRLADEVLDPPWTAFDQRILFRSHDVTAALKEGANCLGLSLGNGWYNPLPLRMWGHRNIRGSMVTGRPRVIACLVVEHPDGTRSTVTTGPGWKVAQGPTVRNSIFLGEERDARLEIPGWDKAGFDASAWQAARVSEAPLEPLKPILDMPPVRATETIRPVAVTSPAGDVHIVDFGTNFTGVPEIDLNVPAGNGIVLRYGEILNPDGTLNPLTSVCGQIKGMRKNDQGVEAPIGGPGAPAIAWQQDVYTARGGKETYRPDFTFHAFRYMEITGLPEAPVLEAIRGIRLHSELPDAGSFSCSNELFNRIQKITRNTFLNNVVSVQSDCPHRERFGYGGDIAVTSEAYLMNFDMAGFYAKTVRDWADGARPDGNFTDTAPFVGVQYCGVGWAMAHPLLLEQLYQHYGDKGLIAEQLPAAIRWFDLEASKRKKGLVTYGLGDHEALKRIAGPVLTTPMFIDTARRMARLARVVGGENDAKRFEQMADESNAAWTKGFLDAPTGKVGGGSQSEQVMALGFGVVPEAARQAVFDRLVAELTAVPDGPALTTGIFGTRFLLEELTRRGRHDLAFALADRKTFPSWGWMLENDATTLWETWKESDNTFSHNHPMFGSISAWFIRHLGGIQAAEDAVGFDRIVIRPRTGHGLEWVKSSHRGVRGLIESNWKINGSGKEFEIVIPPDSEALVELPVAKGEVVTESGKPLAEAGGVTVVEGPVHRMKIGSGKYRFEIRGS
jgi:alpha-L-rhamnosidase